MSSRKKSATSPLKARPNAGGMQLIGVLAGARRLLNIVPTWDAVAERLRPYRLVDVLDIVGRIGVVLRNEGTADREAQLAICRGLFPQDTASALQRRLLFMDIRDAEGTTPPPHHVLFAYSS